MLPQHAALAQALGARGQHVLLADFLQEGVLGQHGHHGEAAHHRGGDRQHQVPQVVHHLAHQRQLLPVVRGQPAQREPLHEGAAAEQHQQQHAQHEAGNRIADQHDDAGDHVEAAARPDRLGDAERHRYQVGQEKRPQTQADRHRQLGLDQLPHAAVLEIALPQVELGKALEHQEVALQRRLVEAVQGLDLLDLLRVDAAAAAVFGAAAAGFAGAAPPFQFHHHLLDRAARDELDDDKGQRDDADQRRDHQQDAFEQVGKHRPVLVSCVRACAGVRKCISALAA
ncbi:hypothetical protein D3C81_884720 [compost metagenome]